MNYLYFDKSEGKVVTLDLLLNACFSSINTYTQEIIFTL